MVSLSETAVYRHICDKLIREPRHNHLEMAAPGHKAELIEAAENFAAAVKNFNGDPSEQMKLLKQADKLRFLVETPLDTVMRQWETVSVKVQPVARMNCSHHRS